jgi:hypothetical protein
MARPTRRNQTICRSLDIVNSDARVNQVFHDVDGYWLWLEPGYTCNELDAHDGHADTVREILSLYRGIVECGCEDCADVVGAFRGGI